MKKRARILVLLLVICYILSTPQIASANSPYHFEDESLKLHKMGLFAGESLDRFNPDLGAKLDRQVGITLLLNFFGKRAEIESLSKYEVNRILSPFQDQKDVSDWARPYMAYAVETGMVLGTSSTTPTLGYSDSLDGVSYAAMILRHLGYTVNRQEFLDSIYRLYEKGAINLSEVDYFQKPQLIKDDAIGMVYGTLFAKCSDGKLLIDKLIESKAVSKNTAISLGVRQDEKPNITPVDFSHRIKSRPTEYNKAYFQILEALKKQSETIEIIRNEHTDSYDKVVEIVNVCVKENPEILYYDGFIYTTNGTITFRYRKDAATNERHMKLLKEKIESIIKEIITPSMTDYQKELAVHHYILENCEYDIGGYNSGQIRAESFNAYGTLCLGVAVCEGYAEAAALLLNSIGVETLVVSGYSRGERHAWNIVKIDGDYYHLDVTWNDPILEYGSEAMKRYDYFNLTDTKISKDHSWDRKTSIPCTAEKYNYFTYNNYVVSNREEFIERVQEEVQRGNKNIQLRIDTSRESSFMLDDAVRTIVNNLFLRCRYSYNESMQVVSLSFY